MKAKWTAPLMIATFSAALAVGTGVSATGMGGGMKSDEHPGAGAATDQDHGAIHSSMNFSDFDTNQDGLVSEQEAAANTRLMDRFHRLDSDNDGNLDKGEFAQFETQPTQYEQEMEQPPAQEQQKVPEHW